MRPMLGFLFAVGFTGALTAEDKDALRYLRETVLDKEFGEGTGTVLRWIESPEVVLETGGDEHRTLLKEVVGELNLTLRESPIELKMIDEARTDRRIVVHFVPERRFAKIAEKNGFKAPGGLDGIVNIRWNTEKKFITRATVIIAIDKVEGEMRRHTLLEEMTQALGPVGDTTVTPKSVLYSKGGDHGKAPTLGDFDRRMLRLLYRHLRPGDGGIEVGVAYARHWDD